MPIAVNFIFGPQGLCMATNEVWVKNPCALDVVCPGKLAAQRQKFRGTYLCGILATRLTWHSCHKKIAKN